MPRSAVGLFGGTFDPVHRGHISIARAFLQCNLINELIVLLSPYPPHKQEQNTSDYSVRLEMLRSVFSEMENIKISTIENSLPKPSYSYRSIQVLKEKRPDTDFYFCMGEDSLEQFKTWKHHKKILQEVDLIIAQRPGADHDHLDNYILEKTHFVDHEPIDISSSDIRNLISNGESVLHLVPEVVYSMIKDHNLYKNTKSN